MSCQHGWDSLDFFFLETYKIFFLLKHNFPLSSITIQTRSWMSTCNVAVNPLSRPKMSHSTQVNDLQNDVFPIPSLSNTFFFSRCAWITEMPNIYCGTCFNIFIYCCTSFPYVFLHKSQTPFFFTIFTFSHFSLPNCYLSLLWSFFPFLHSPCFFTSKAVSVYAFEFPLQFLDSAVHV